jgi:hypothetical protein
MEFEVPSAVTIKVTIFYIETPCSLEDRYQNFGEKYCLLLQSGILFG